MSKPPRSTPLFVPLSDVDSLLGKRFINRVAELRW
jgi:hypothetical protein